MSERRGNPFGWVILGFIVGVLATFGVILFLSSSDGGYEDGPSEIRTAADDAATAAMNGETSASQPPPHRMEQATPPAATAPVVAAPVERPATVPHELDPQVADDAAAAGMTSRTR
ncbi:hypothetical protein [Caulobacter sp. RHG1]|uniref:hypothetical protein n=1 Tax=Caulobacter sp. (strain RHG1) TaxID=2545762 RepID=UPI0015575A98|nr:hypothetical protein [Caulobacter sp. RHG1]NQE61749.1 hypothetical protein [Caulobacter sp. RHG1]